jgi:hypothetical protein
MMDWLKPIPDDHAVDWIVEKSASRQLAQRKKAANSR